MSPLFKGLIFGFSIAAPVGPIGLLCIRRSMGEGQLAGFISGLGAATADALYGLVAALGVTALTNALLEHRIWLQLGGGAFLVYLGISTIRAAPQSKEARTARGTGLVSAYVSTLVLTLANPMTILSFVGIFAGLGSGMGTQGVADACLLVAGVFTGSAAWWLILSAAAGWLGSRLERGGLRIVNVVSGLIIAGFGAWQMVGLI